MTKRSFVRYPDQATQALLAQAETAIRYSEDIGAIVDTASYRLAKAIQRCDSDLPH